MTIETLKKAFSAALGRLQDNKQKIFAQWVTAWFMDGFTHWQHSSEKMHEFGRWFRALSPSKKFVLKNLAYGASGVIHALPDGTRLGTLVTAEILSDLVMELGRIDLHVTPQEAETIVAEALPVLQAELSRAKPETPDSVEHKNFFERYIFDPKVLADFLDQDYQAIEGRRNQLKETRATWKKRGWRRYL